MSLTNYWKLNETSGISIADSIGGLTLTAINTSIVDGISGKARNINGTTDYVNTTAVNNIGNSEYQIWLLTSSANNSKILFGSEANTTNTFACRMGTQANGNINLFYGNYFGNINVILNTSKPLLLNTWQMLSFKLSSGIQERFLNGVSIGTISNGNSYGNANQVHIGYAGTNSRAGKYDEYKKYNTVLSAGERKNQYLAYKGFF